MITAIIIAAVLAFLAALALLTARVVALTVVKPDPRDTSFVGFVGAVRHDRTLWPVAAWSAGLVAVPAAVVGLALWLAGWVPAISAGAGAASVLIVQRALKIASPVQKGPAE